MTKLPREQATQEEDLPHRFEQEPPEHGWCFVCGAGASDPRHEAWTKMDLASREEAAAVQNFRELGS